MRNEMAKACLVVTVKMLNGCGHSTEVLLQRNINSLDVDVFLIMP